VKPSKLAPHAWEGQAGEDDRPSEAAGPAPAGRNRREYLSVQQLAELVPWSPSSIRSMICRGQLRQGEHFFKPFGAASHPIFRWTSIVNLIEGTKSCATPDDKIPLANGAEIELGEDD